MQGGVGPLLGAGQEGLGLQLAEHVEQQSLVPRVQLAAQVVEQEDRRPAALGLEQIRFRQLERDDQHALLALGGDFLEGVSSQGGGQVVALGAEQGQAAAALFRPDPFQCFQQVLEVQGAPLAEGPRPMPIQVDRLAQQVLETPGPRSPQGPVAGELSPAFLAEHGPFDAAVMLDVIEHVQDPGAALAALHAAMRPGAPLLITTGDFGSLLARVMGRRWRLMTPPQHLWFFSPRTLSALLARHGFRVHTIEHPWKQVPLALVAYQATRYLGGQSLVRRFTPPGRLPLNLFDAMRVIAFPQ